MNGIDLKITRVRAGLTLWDVGQLVGLHAARISEMERGRRPISEAVVQVLDKWLFEEAEIQPKVHAGSSSV